MRITVDATKNRGWIRETLAGCTGALAVLPLVLTIPLLAFAALGAAAPPVALLAAFVTASIGGLVHALLSRTSLPVAGPSSATALTLATLVAQLVTDPLLAPGDGRPARVFSGGGVRRRVPFPAALPGEAQGLVARSADAPRLRLTCW